MDKHTPTPWDAEGTTIYASRNRGEEICHATGYDEAHPEYREEKSEDENQANADHIVKCVNTHDALVAALRDALSAIAVNSNEYQPLKNHPAYVVGCALLDKIGSTEKVKGTGQVK